MSSERGPALPFLPGCAFRDPTKTSFHRSQTLGYKNGFAFSRLPTVGIGGERLYVNQLSQAELDELSNTRPTLTYGQARQAPPSGFIPAHVAFDKKVERSLFQEYQLAELGDINSQLQGSWDSVQQFSDAIALSQRQLNPSLKEAFFAQEEDYNTYTM